jgi:hypothetical protein
VNNALTSLAKRNLPELASQAGLVFCFPPTGLMKNGRHVTPRKAAPWRKRLAYRMGGTSNATKSCHASKTAQPNYTYKMLQ